MNNSGECISYLLTRFAAQAEDLVVVYDDMELPLGHLRIRRSGGDGGHNGARSIIASLDTEAFPRIRLGIGPPPPGQDPVQFVLGGISEGETAVVARALETVASAVECLLEEGIDVAMTRFN
jgi:PTH1 family peptidyl-tRNA hydrolase